MYTADNDNDPFSGRVLPRRPHDLNCKRRSSAPERQFWAKRPGVTCFATPADLQAVNDNDDGGDPPNGPARIHSNKPTVRVTFNKTIFTWAAAAAKVVDHSEGTGPGELFMFMALATNPDIVNFSMEGARYSSCEVTYTFDYVAWHAERGLIFGEVKADWTFFCEPVYAALMRRIAGACSAVRVSFQKHTTADIIRSSSGSLYWHNVVTAFYYAETAFTPTDTEAVNNLLAGRNGVALAEIREILRKDTRSADAVAMAMHCNRVLALDLTKPIDRDAQVKAIRQPLTTIDISSFNLVVPT